MKVGLRIIRERLVDLLAQHDTKATFFVLGWVAERYPGLVKMLVAQGHEIASHGYGHELITDQTPGMFRDDVRRAKGILEDICGKRVYGYVHQAFQLPRIRSGPFPFSLKKDTCMTLVSFRSCTIDMECRMPLPRFISFVARQVAYGRCRPLRQIFLGRDCR